MPTRRCSQQTVQSYKEYLVLTQDRYAGGVASDADVSQAETQLYTTQAQLRDLGRPARAVGARHRDADRQAAHGIVHSARARFSSLFRGSR